MEKVQEKMNQEPKIETDPKRLNAMEKVESEVKPSSSNEICFNFSS